MSKKPETRQFPYRDAKAVVDALEAHASIRGRSLSGELRLAVRLWLAEALLAEVLSPAPPSTGSL